MQQPRKRGNDWILAKDDIDLPAVSSRQKLLWFDICGEFTGEIHSSDSIMTPRLNRLAHMHETTYSREWREERKELRCRPTFMMNEKRRWSLSKKRRPLHGGGGANRMR